MHGVCGPYEIEPSRHGERCTGPVRSLFQPILWATSTPSDVPPLCPRLVCLPTDTLVLQRLQELLGIFCTRLEHSDGLLASAYTPARANHTWQRVPHAAINQGRWTPPHTSELSDSHWSGGLTQMC